MHKCFKTILTGLVFSIFFCACSPTVDPEQTKFKNDLENFCNNISELDASMNQIDPANDNAPTQLLEYLDEVDMRFRSFAELDFPEEFDYLEHLADEASEYMTEAVTYYHNAFSNNSYNEYTAQYAQENYSRAIKRIKIILDFLHGETPTGDDVVISYETNPSSDDFSGDEE